MAILTGPKSALAGGQHVSAFALRTIPITAIADQNHGPLAVARHWTVRATPEALD
jgi:hypothetical protein